MHIVVERRQDWDDTVLDSLRPNSTWHFEIRKEVKNLTLKREVTPDDAVNLDIAIVKEVSN